jgi:hypothetical protein
LEAGTQSGDVFELPISVGAGLSGDGFAIDPERIVHVMQQPRHGIGRDGDAELPR